MKRHDAPYATVADVSKRCFAMPAWFSVKERLKSINVTVDLISNGVRMSKAKTIGKYTLNGLWMGPVIGLLLVTFTSSSCSLAGIKSALVANLIFAGILVPTGMVIGFFVGIVKAAKGQD